MSATLTSLNFILMLWRLKIVSPRDANAIYFSSHPHEWDEV